MKIVDDNALFMSLVVAHDDLFVLLWYDICVFLLN